MQTLDPTLGLRTTNNLRGIGGPSILRGLDIKGKSLWEAKHRVKDTSLWEDRVKDKGRIFIIDRSGRNRTRKENVGIEENIQFYTVDPDTNKTINLSESDKIKTVDKIHKTLGLTTKDSFLLTNISSNVHSVSLLNMSSSDISDIFSKIFNIEEYSTIYKNALKTYKRYNSEIKTIQDQLKVLEVKTEEPCDLEKTPRQHGHWPRRAECE